MRDWTIRLILLLLVAMPITMEAKEKDKPLIYEVSCGGSANQGFYLVKVKAVVDKKEIGDNILKRCAIHGVLFRGYSGGGGCISQPPMAGSAMVEQQYSDFFIPFFRKGGGCEAYATLIEGSMQVVRQGKQYIVTGIISVSKEQLRKDLEAAGVVKRLNSGF